MFQISSKLDYGLILLRALALRSRRGPVALKTIAEEERLPYRYLTQIVIPLKRAGIVKSYEGIRGGYELAVPPERVTLQEISAILAPRVKLNRCLLEGSDVCHRKEACTMSPWWKQFNRRFQKMLSGTTLADLI